MTWRSRRGDHWCTMWFSLGPTGASWSLGLVPGASAGRRHHAGNQCVVVSEAAVHEKVGRIAVDAHPPEEVVGDLRRPGPGHGGAGHGWSRAGHCGAVVSVGVEGRGVGGGGGAGEAGVAAAALREGPATALPFQLNCQPSQLWHGGGSGETPRRRVRTRRGRGRTRRTQPGGSAGIIHCLHVTVCHFTRV